MRSIRLSLCTGAAALLVLALGGEASATPIGGPSCSSCDGAIYDLSTDGVAAVFDATHHTYQFTLSIDTNTYDPGGSSSPPYYLADVAIKVSSSVFAASLVGAPGGTGNWSAVSVDSGINAGGCSGSGSGFICTDGLENGGKGHAITTGNGAGYDYVFVFDVTVDNSVTFVDGDSASIKARYVDSADTKVGSLLSEDVSIDCCGVPPPPPPPHDIPEPATMLFLGLSALGLGLIRRRRAING